MRQASGRRIGVVVVATLAVAILVLAGYRQLRGPPGGGEARPVERVILGAYAGDSAGLVWIAAEQGYFRDAGLDVAIEEFEAGKLAADALIEGRVDVCTAAAFVLVHNSFREPGLRILASVARADIQGLVARRDRGIRAPADLEGKRVGVTRKSGGEFLLGLFLLFNGLGYEDVDIVDLVPSAIRSGLIEGTIDAAYTWEPHLYELNKRLGDEALVLTDPRASSIDFLLLSRRDWLEARPEAARRLVRALLRAQSFVTEDPDAARELLRRRFDLDEDYMARSWRIHHFEVGLSQGLLLAMEDQARWMRETGLVEAAAIPNYLDFLYLDALEAESPGAVRIIR